MEPDTAIKVQNVSKDFHYTSRNANSIKSAFTGIFRGKERNSKDIQHALKDVSFEVKAGEFFGIVGRNGSGKSTLLKMTAGIYQPNKGKITVNGKLVPFIELGVGFNPELTGKENVYLNGALLGFSRKEVAAMYDDIVEFAELQKFMNQKLRNYSSGMQVRLAFSMAVRAQADILLIDEVLAVGDANFQRKCFEYFKKLKKDKKTVVFISHDMGAIQEYCDRVILIDNGRITHQGKPNQVAEEYFKLFNDEEIPRQTIKSSKSDRWGDNKAEITKVSSEVTANKIRITYSVKANADLAEIIAGFRIRSSDGDDVMGTNTKKEKVSITDYKKGDVLTVAWELDNILADGEYIVDPSIVYPDEITVIDWWNEADVLSVRKNRRLPFKIDPGYKITVKKQK